MGPSFLCWTCPPSTLTVQDREWHPACQSCLLNSLRPSLSQGQPTILRAAGGAGPTPRDGPRHCGQDLCPDAEGRTVPRQAPEGGRRLRPEPPPVCGHRWGLAACGGVWRGWGPWLSGGGQVGWGWGWGGWEGQESGGVGREPGARSVPETRGTPSSQEIPLYHQSQRIFTRDEDFYSCPFLSFPHHFLCDVLSFPTVSDCSPPPVALFFKRKKKLYFE